ncbi:MAG TPA: MFS transporter [Vineibacter sp.]|nr:MFS transporter [Vineibacter sp.]
MTVVSPAQTDTVQAGGRRRTLATCCGVHALHDGYTDLLNVLYPLLQAQFGLSYTAVGALKLLSSGAMASGQIPSALLAERLGATRVLALGTALAAAGYIVAGLAGGLLGVAIGLVLAGLGGSTQHPVSSSLISAAYDGGRSRTALGTYNFAGDVGKVLLPAAFAALAAVLSWREGLFAVAALGLGAALVMPLFLPATPTPVAPQATAADATRGADRPGAFRLLLAIHMADGLTRTGFLLFLPFLLRDKGADLPTIGLALSLLFAGGAAGKLACGWLGARLGVLRTVFLTELLTASLIAALLPLSLAPALAVLPLVGIALNGTSSVLYGTVPEFVPAARRVRAFGVFYTGGSVAGALGPPLFGLCADATSVPATMLVIAAVALVTLPLTWALRPALRSA